MHQKTEHAEVACCNEVYRYNIYEHLDFPTVSYLSYIYKCEKNLIDAWNKNQYITLTKITINTIISNFY
jgi:hypothetical protein